MPDVLLMQVFFERASGHQAVKQPAFLLGGKLRAATDGFQSQLDPALLGGLDNVHVFGTDRAAVGAVHNLQNLLERRVMRVQSLDRTAIENPRHILGGQSVEHRV